MGARTGSISYTRYLVEGGRPEAAAEELLGRVEEFRFADLTPESEEDSTHGWTVLDDLLSTDFRKDSVFFDDYIGLGLRIDRWSLPGALLRARIEERTRTYMKEFDKKKLFRSEKAALREEITRTLRRRALPTATVIDMVWDLGTGQVRFWSHAKRATELFESLFESTFGMPLRPLSPYATALVAGLDGDQVGRLADLDPSRFTSFE